MQGINQAMVSGKLTSDAEISTGKTGQRYGHFLLMQTYFAAGQPRTRYFPCFTSEEQVRKMMKYGKGKKGSYVFVKGVMDPSKFTDEKGNTKSSFSLKLCTVFFDESGGQAQGQGKPAEQASYAEMRKQVEESAACDDDFFDE